MGQPTGRADLPLHHGHVPPWLSGRMARLGRVIVEALVLSYGRDEVLRRLAHPFWFQALGSVMGMDWHSSGITTSVMGALKRGLAPVEHELGIHICGGRGRHSRRTPEELVAIAERTGLDGSGLVNASRLVAKVDNAAVQDGFQIYLHCFVVTDDGAWTVVQQGMDEARGQARRYHWLSLGLTSFVDEPHTGIAGPSRGAIVNLTDKRAERARDVQVELAKRGPDHVLRELTRARAEGTALQPHLAMPRHHDVRPEDVVTRRLHATLAAAATVGPESFERLLLTPGVGPRTVEALALVAEVIHGAPSRFTDPARFSFAHGGKDGHPFPVPLKVYDESLRVLREAIAAAKLGQADKLDAIARLDAQARALEAHVSGPSVAEYIERERERSYAYGGMTVMGPARPPSSRAPFAPAAAAPPVFPSTAVRRQLRLPGI